jgi:uncharacterized protein (TIGR02266 family)
MAKSAAEKRQFLRFPVVLPVDFGKGDYFLSTICSNLSKRGLFVETSQDFALGERLCLFISIPNQGDPVKVIGEVVWKSVSNARDLNGNAMVGVGIKFLDYNPNGAQLVTNFINGRTKANERLFNMEGNELVL